MIKNQIAFLVHEPALYDHYIGIWRNLDNKKFQIILLDSFKNSQNNHFLNNANIFIQKIKSYGYNYSFLNNVLSNNIMFRYVLSNINISGKSLENKLPIRDLAKNNIKKVINIFSRLVGKDKQYVLKSNQYLSTRVGFNQVRMMYGADISEGWSLAKWNEIYDIFLCHGPNDAKEIGSRFRDKKIYQIGYPRYDDYFNVDAIADELKNDFSLSPEKKTLIWLPTFGDEICSITLYAKYIAKLTNKYNVIVRPHPISFRKAPQNIRELQKFKFQIDDKASRNMNALYKIADYVLCDYGGTSFSALYLDKNIILLNVPGAKNTSIVRNSSNLYLRKELAPVVNLEDAQNLDMIIENENIWSAQALQRKIIFEKYFAPFQGKASERVAAILTDLIDGKIH